MSRTRKARKKKPNVRTSGNPAVAADEGSNDLTGWRKWLAITVIFIIVVSYIGLIVAWFFTTGTAHMVIMIILVILTLIFCGPLVASGFGA